MVHPIANSITMFYQKENWIASEDDRDLNSKLLNRRIYICNQCHGRQANKHQQMEDRRIVSPKGKQNTFVLICSPHSSRQ
jgi:uncharacterized protein YlaI